LILCLVGALAPHAVGSRFGGWSVGCRSGQRGGHLRVAAQVAGM